MIPGGSRPSINSRNVPPTGQGHRRNARRRGPRSRVFYAALRSLVWLEEQKTSMVILLVGGVVLLVLFLGLFPFLLAADASAFGKFPKGTSICAVSYTHLRAHETRHDISYAVFCLKKKK